MAERPKPTEGSVETTSKAAALGASDLENFAEAAATAEEKIRSLKDTSELFYSLITDKKVGLQEATKLFYESVNATTEVRKSFGDLSAVTDGVTEKVSLMNLAIGKAQSALRESTANRIKDNQTLEETNKKIKELQAAIGDEDIVGKIQKEFDAIEKLKEITNDITKGEGERAKALETIIEKQEQIKQIEEDENVIALASLSLRKEELQNSIEQNQLKEAEAALNLPLLNYENQRLQAIQKTSGALDGILSKLTNGAERSNIFGSAFLAMQTSIDGTKKGLGDLITTLGAGLKESLLDPEKSINRVFNLINDKLIKSTLEFDSALAKVGQSTGGFRKEFEGVAMNMGGVSFVALSQYGVTLEKFGQAYQGLSRAIGGFNNMLDSQRKLLTESAASMNMLGVSADTYGKLVGKFMGAIGKTAEGSRDMINTLAKDAIALGKSVGEYTSQFEGAMSRISGYGREAVAIFKELEAVSAATKGVVASQDLLAISDKFKDFDSAADAVSKLNAVLGGTSVNILDMMRADPAEQIMMIKRAAGEAGLEFDRLNVGYKRLLAEYFGGDINKAQAFFNANMAEAQSLMNKAVESEKELEKRKQNNIAFQEKLNALIDNMKVGLTGVLNILNPVIAFMTKLMSFPGGPLIATFGMIGGAIVLMGRAIDRVTARIVAKVAAINQSAAASTQGAAQADAAATREVAAVERTTAAYRAQMAAKQQSAATSTGTPVVGGAPGPKGPPSTTGGIGGLGMLGGMAGIMLLGAGLSHWSETVELSRQEEVKKRESELKIKELEAEKRLFGSTITTQRTMEDGVVDSDGKVTTLHKDDTITKLPNGAILIGKPGGPVEKSLNDSNSSFREAIATGTKVDSASTPYTSGESAMTKATPSSPTAAKDQAPVNVNVTAHLILDNQKIQLLSNAIDDYKQTIKS